MAAREVAQQRAQHRDRRLEQRALRVAERARPVLDARRVGLEVGGDGRAEPRIQQQPPQPQRAHDALEAPQARAERGRRVAERRERAGRAAVAVEAHREALAARVGHAVRVGDDHARDLCWRRQWVWWWWW